MEILKSAAVNPSASMMAIKNDNLVDIANEIQQKLQKVIESLAV